MADVRGGPPPLLTRMSMPPNAVTVRSTRRSRSAGFVRSPRTASAPIRSASCRRTSRRRANIVTLAPSSASASAIARPMPDEAPQTIAVLARRPRSIAEALCGEDADDFADGVRGLVECRPLVVAQVELDDRLDASRAELHRHAHVEPVDPVLALEVCRAREHALLVEHDRVDHLRGRRARCVPGRRAEQLDDLAAAFRRALDQLVD